MHTHHTHTRVQVFHLLLQLKRASWTLKSIFAHLKTSEDAKHHSLHTELRNNGLVFSLTAEGLEKWQLRQLQTYRYVG